MKKCYLSLMILLGTSLAAMQSASAGLVCPEGAFKLDGIISKNCKCQAGTIRLNDQSKRLVVCAPRAKRSPKRQKRRRR